MMRGIIAGGVALVPLLAAGCNALSHFDGAGISPSNNPIVDKYHSTDKVGSSTYIEHNLVLHTVPGIVIGAVLFLICSVYFAHRWCGCCKCFSCKKKEKVEEGLYRSRKSKRSTFKDAKKEQKLSHPVVSAILRIVLCVLFLGSVAGIAVGIVGSSQFHNSLVSTLQKLDDKASDINSTLSDTSSTLLTLNISHMPTPLPNDSIHDMLDAGTDLINNANKVQATGNKYDGFRNIVTFAIYFAVAFPLFLGLLGALVGKGKLAYAMSVMLPLGILAMWILFSFHYATFIVNVDTCYAVNNFLLDPNANNTEDASLDFLVTCTNNTALDHVIDYVGDAITETQTELANSKNNETTDRLTNQLASLTSLNSSLNGLSGCTPVRDLLNDVYTDLCGVMVESSLYMWQTQVCLAIAVTVLFFFGLIAEYRIARRKREEGYNPLLNLNDDE